MLPEDNQPRTAAGRRWLRAYRKEPARLGRAESALWMALLVGLAAAGLVLLVTQS